ncbi:MAG: outer membrane protein assembly factor [Bacteroidales bacterium]|jgi:outer membrane protein assembly factor BamA|nr:outer membrane protein assembly factor [Bacteroidales bacterium]
MKPFLKMLFFILLLLSCLHRNAFTADTTKHIKTGLTFGALPSIAFDTDIGFKYGILTNFYLFGDGSTYPKYLHSFYLEWYQTTKGSGLWQFIYDSDYLIPKIRLTAEVSYFTEKAIDFYGFNGYRAYYNPDLEDKDHSDYISRMFYRHERKMLRIRSDFQGNIVGRRLRWMAGFEFNKFDVGSVDIDKLNKGKKDDDRLPDVPLLYDRFVDWGVIPDNQKRGDDHYLLKFGLVYDTRDNEPNPMKGIWSEVMLLTAPSWMGNPAGFTKLALTHRQYFTLIDEVLNLAIRLSYQPKIGGTIPFYMLPYVYNTNITRDGLGGAKTLRGILRNRVVGQDIFYGNVELRWKFLRTILWNQNIYLALSAFTDFGQVTRDYKFTFDPAHTEARDWFAEGDSEKLHLSYGGGISGALNHNFVAHINYGIAADRRDGKSGLYIGLNYLF